MNSTEITNLIQSLVNEISEIKDDGNKVTVSDVYWHEEDENGCNWNISTIQNGNAYINEILHIIAVKRQSINLTIDL